MLTKRISRHILFWALYYIVCLYNELYLSASFSRQPTAELFIQSALSVLLLLILKLSVAYFIMYKVLPGWIDEGNTPGFIISIVVAIVCGTLVMRGLMHWVIWPFIYEETHTSMSASSLVARFFYSMLDLMQVVGVAMCIKLYKIRLASLKHEKSLEVERSRAEVMLLKSQTNPHFLFNTLNSIYSLSRAGSREAPDAIMRLSKILRYTIYDSEKKMILIEEELKVINDFIELQQLRFGKRIEMKLRTQLDAGPTQITPLLLLPIVENAYKHCHEQNAVVWFDLSVKDNRCTLVTSNPISEEMSMSEGSGLRNLKRQLELLYKEFSLDYFLSDNRFNLKLMINLSSYTGHELFDIRR